MNACFGLNAGVHNRCDVDVYDGHVPILLGNFDTSLLLFLEDHANKPVNSDEMFYTFIML